MKMSSPNLQTLCPSKISAYMVYCIAGKFGEFGKSSAVRQTKLVVTINNPLAGLFIRQTFFHQMLEKSKFTKHSPRQTFLLHGIVQCTHYMFSSSFLPSCS